MMKSGGLPGIAADALWREERAKRGLGYMALEKLE